MVASRARSLAPLVIVSGTQFTSLLNVSCKQADLEERNVLFMSDGGQVYLKKMFERIT